ncbi:T9SS type A sorting domain-containing protein [Pedobacter sp. SYSU D00535]|uniref:T9SS type A sorting domain-containing protein n=1 Tax=Pedobacter sp. SYSU D00535 TaxID=2810308 RepID=UPI001A97AE2E|nr:T9SS type A sorting domain-containing protein [Pedobacter sp. SYSU D00535]
MRKFGRPHLILKIMLLTLVVTVSYGEVPYGSELSTVREINKASISLEIEPGVVTKELSLTVSEAQTGSTIDITDASGKKVSSHTLEAGTTKAKIDVSKLASGSYFVIYTDGSSRASKIFVKQ